MWTCLVHSIKDTPRPPPQKLPKKIGLLCILHAGAHRHNLNAGSAIPAGWCPTSSVPAAVRDVPVPEATCSLATHFLAADMQPACLWAIVKQQECTRYSELDVNNVASKNDGWSSRSYIRHSHGKICMLSRLQTTDHTNAAGDVCAQDATSSCLVSACSTKHAFWVMWM